MLTNEKKELIQSVNVLSAEEKKAISPMMRQYLSIKEEYSDCILLYRLGDFYEMFFDDAVTISSMLGLTLTGRDCGLYARAAMCGVPFHAVSSYIFSIVKKNLKVAICEQELVTLGGTKGLARRDVVRVITPGTVTDDSLLNRKENNYIVSVYMTDNGGGIAYADISVGSFSVVEYNTADYCLATANEVARIAPGEIIFPNDCQDLSKYYQYSVFSAYSQGYDAQAYKLENARRVLTEHFGVNSMLGMGLDEMPYAACAAGALVSYLRDTQMNSLAHMKKIDVVDINRRMILDEFTRTNLELVKPLRDDGDKKSTLLGIMDETITSMGARMLKNWVLEPLRHEIDISLRLRAVTELLKLPVEADRLRELLREVSDIERICAKVSYNSLTPKNCVLLRTSLNRIKEIHAITTGFASPRFLALRERSTVDEKLLSLLECALADDAPQNVKDGGVIKDGYDSEVDKYRRLSGEGKQWLVELEDKERVNTGIKSLKVGYNRVFGYYFEVSKSYVNSVPDYFIRKQTLSTGERYFTEELKRLEEAAISAEELCYKRETELFAQITQNVLNSLETLQYNALAVSELDVYLSFAAISKKYNYVMPEINDSGIIRIEACRHPVVERSIVDFNPNDVELDMKNNRLLIITGPNMAGKSTYMRQTAIVVLMAHIGCYVPAKSASICIVDRLYTRVGASDNLSFGQSTFMVEMNELACILNSATENSLVILDEIGRGTATYDGMSIARAAVEYLATDIKAKTMFATHYHELISLENEFDCVKNYSVTVRETEDEIVFLHKIVRGGADKSFGIQVAQLAGLPAQVVTRAKEILSAHEAEKSIGSAN